MGKAEVESARLLQKRCHLKVITKKYQAHAKFVVCSVAAVERVYISDEVLLAIENDLPAKAIPFCV